MKIDELLLNLKKNVSLRKQTSFKIGGQAKYFFEAKTRKDLVKAVKAAKDFNLPFFVLGGGSNLIVSDKKFNGLVIKFGQPLALFVSKGMDWAVGIPGTIQGAVYGNAGAFGKSMKDEVKQVEVLDVNNFKIKKFNNKDCCFSYRESVFKKNKNLIILSVEIKKKKTDLKKLKKYLDYKKKSQPLNYFSAGSIFKNEKLTKQNEKTIKNYSQFEEFKKTGKIPAAWLIEKAGLKGKRIGQAEVSKKHTNFIVNLGDAKANDVKKLINLTKKQVEKKFKIKLIEEIQYFNF
jgi:UDP-N-acetylmuramate dehydrogenase